MPIILLGSLMKSEILSTRVRIVSPNDRTVDIFLFENEKYPFKWKCVNGDLVSVYTLPG